MALKKLIDSNQNGYAKILNIHNEYPASVQIQISQDGQDAYINLDHNELKLLRNELNQIVNSK